MWWWSPISARRIRLKNSSAQLVQAPSKLYASSWLMRFISKRACNTSQAAEESALTVVPLAILERTTRSAVAGRGAGPGRRGFEQPRIDRDRLEGASPAVRDRQEDHRRDAPVGQ